MIYTSAPGPEAPRNIAARDILDSLERAGISIWGSGLAHEPFTVLVKTIAPAVLIEFGFHTNREEVLLLMDPAYREKLALATARGICSFLGVAWEEPDRPAPWAEEAWDKAVELGILDGTAPQGTVTREMLAVVLDRCGLLEGPPARRVRGAFQIRPLRRYRRPRSRYKGRQDLVLPSPHIQKLSARRRALPRWSSLVYTSSICHSPVSSSSLSAGSQPTRVFSPSRTVRGLSRSAVRR